MNLIADEGVDKPIVDALRNAGFDVVYILETNQGADDQLVLDIANNKKRILLTQDKDFGELVFRLKNAHFGVVLIRLNGYSSLDKAAIILKFILKYQTELYKSFTVIQPNAIRIRKA
jgi:predicted nuclease of predicted toxin-antitoxin system